jgi:hypothetical protein
VERMAIFAGSGHSGPLPHRALDAGGSVARVRSGGAQALGDLHEEFLERVGGAEAQSHAARLPRAAAPPPNAERSPQVLGEDNCAR